jgi:hypothetical protein
VLVRVEKMMDDANRALGPVAPARPTVSSGKGKQAQVPDKGDALAASLEGRALGNRN